MRRGGAPIRCESGYAMAALLVAMGVLMISLAVVLPAWSRQVQREREAELIFRGEQYARAIARYQRTYPGAYPPNLDVLVEQKFLRRRYEDPMVEDGEFQLLYPIGGPVISVGLNNGEAAGRPQGVMDLAVAVRDESGESRPGEGPQVLSPGVVVTTSEDQAFAGVAGVVSRSHAEALRVYQDKTHYDEWQFTPQNLGLETSGRAGGRGVGRLRSVMDGLNRTLQGRGGRGIGGGARGRGGGLPPAPR